MKFIAIILLNLILYHTVAQSRFPLKESATWTVVLKEWSYQCELKQGNDIYQYFFDGDTLINEVSYLKMFKTGIAYYDSLFNYKNVYVGALRDADNKIYFIDKNNSTELLIYNFNLEVEDSTFTGINQQESKVYDIDTLDDGRKAFSCATKYPWGGKCSMGYIIEGIGGRGGILEYMPCNHPGLQESYLVCYTESGKAVYTSNLNNCECDINMYTSLPSTQKETKIYPIPAKNQLTIELSASHSDRIIEITDLLGKRVWFKKLSNNELVNSLNINFLKNDIYILKITGKDFALSKKIIINR